MKTTIRIPTTQYGFVEFEVEAPTVADAILLHNDAITFYAGGEGLEVKEWNATLDNMLLTGECNPDTIQRMSERQQLLINEIKKAFKRIKSKETVPVVNE